MICAASAHKHDVLFHVIYGGDDAMIIDFVRGGASRLHSITGCSELEDMMREVLASSQNHDYHRLGMDTLRALFFLIANVDMPIKEYLCAPGDRYFPCVRSCAIRNF
jgi:hypothetical protein